MFVDVVPIVRQLVPGLLKHRRPSVACIRTTRPRYLVFDGDAAQPACVVEFGEAERLLGIDSILTQLHQRCPGAVPRPLACAPWGAGPAVHIQEGLPGLPWFRLADTLPTTAAWQSLLDRAVGVMGRLHAAIATVPGWTGTVDVREALAEQVRLCLGNRSPISSELLRQVEESVHRVKAPTVVPTFWQHGDFSLNNLMVSPDSMAVIDFEEFGLTRMPLHDAFGLAFSFQHSQNEQCPIPLKECLEQCIAAEASPREFDDETIRALLLHHLLWRINQSHGHPTRARLRERLTAIAGQVAAAPGNGLAAIA